MNENEITNQNNNTESNSSGKDLQKKQKSEKKHLIKCTWLRRLLKVFAGILIFILIIPVLLYIPPIQSILKDAACDIIYDNTGMKVSIDRFSLKFPVDISLENVTVIEATGDTMINAGEAVADVKLLPLLSLDVQINKLRLIDGYYRMVAEDSAMILSARLGQVSIDGNSNADISSGNINLNHADIKNGHISVFMNVWKSKPKPDEAPSPWKINAKQIDLENVRYSMSMLPAIDTLDFNMSKGLLQNASINLTDSKINAQSLDIKGGYVQLLTPTTDYIATHPAPVDTTKSNKAPMTIQSNRITIENFQALYAVDGASPLPGFDSNYIKVDNLNIAISDFYNQAAVLNVPVTSLKGTERCGLSITDGSGILGIDSDGLKLDNFIVSTTESNIDANIYLPYPFMSGGKDNPKMVALADLSLGFADIENFMPALKDMTALFPKNDPLKIELDANGTLASLDLKNLNISVSECLDMAANGHFNNLSDPDRLQGEIDINGIFKETSMINNLMSDNSLSFPTFEIDGHARIDKNDYTADLSLSSGEEQHIDITGNLNLSTEKYSASINISEFNIGNIIHDMGLGVITADISADGKGFNPLSTSSSTDFTAHIDKAEYDGHEFGNIDTSLTLENGNFDLSLISSDPMMDIIANASGLLDTDYYEFDLSTDITYVDLYALGFTEDMNSGSAKIDLKGWVEPEEMYGDIDLTIGQFDWNLPEQYIHLPAGFDLKIKSLEDNVSLDLEGDKLNIEYSSPYTLNRMLDKLSAGSEEIFRQIEEKQLNLNEIRPLLPEFEFSINAKGDGLLRQFLAGAGMNFNNMNMSLVNGKRFDGNISLIELNTGSTRFDTIDLNLKDRGRLLDYKLHIGNNKKNMPELATVNINGYIGGNRASASLTQKNAAGETGYRVGLTAALLDSTISVHFTPLNAAIGYMSWEINEDNYLGYCFANKKMDANLLATGKNNGKIALHTELNNDGNNQLVVNLANLQIEDFMKLSASAPSVKGTINSDMTLVNDGKAIVGQGIFSLNNFKYDRQNVGSLDFEFDAGLNFSGETEATVSLLLDKNKILSGHGIVSNDSLSDEPMELDLQLSKFPLKIVNPFIGADVAELSGHLDGNMTMTGSFLSPELNGEMVCDAVEIYLPVIGSSLKLDTEPILLKNNILVFNNFGIWGVNDNPLVIDGKINAESFSKIGIDLDIAGRNVQLIGNDKRSRSDIYGKLFVNFDASLKGNTEYLDTKADVTILPATDIYYTLSTAQSTLTQQTSDENIVKFVEFADTAKSTLSDSIPNSMKMKIEASLNLMNGAKATVNLSADGKNRAVINPNGKLVYSQSYMGDSRMNGQLNLGNGYVRYTPPLMSEKLFNFNSNSYVLWNGDMMNPILNIHATDDVKANVKQDGQNSRYITFKVDLSVTNTLSSPKILFDLSTNEDATVQNELLSMSADQRSTQAINLLLYNSYTGPSTKSSADLMGNPLYTFLESQLNSWAASNIRGVDLSFGIDQYDKTVDGQDTKATSYSYQVSKSLFDNRFKIVVGGNYSTDASADENFAQNLISDISFEYTLKQTNNLSMYVKLFRHTGFESILEGEITETGAGFVMKRKINNLKELFRFRRRKKSTDGNRNDSIIPITTQPKEEVKDTFPEVDETPLTEGYDILN